MAMHANPHWQIKYITFKALHNENNAKFYKISLEVGQITTAMINDLIQNDPQGETEKFLCQPIEAWLVHICITKMVIIGPCDGLSHEQQ